MATSASVSAGSGSPGVSVPGTVSCQNDSERYLTGETMQYIVAGDSGPRGIGHAWSHGC